MRGHDYLSTMSEGSRKLARDPCTIVMSKMMREEKERLRKEKKEMKYKK